MQARLHGQVWVVLVYWWSDFIVYSIPIRCGIEQLIVSVKDITIILVAILYGWKVVYCERLHLPISDSSDLWSYAVLQYHFSGILNNLFIEEHSLHAFFSLLGCCLWRYMRSPDFQIFPHMWWFRTCFVTQENAKSGALVEKWEWPCWSDYRAFKKWFRSRRKFSWLTAGL